MPCPGPDCDCNPCLRRVSFARWGLSDYSSSDGRWTALAGGDTTLWQTDIIPGLPEHGRKTIVPHLDE